MYECRNKMCKTEADIYGHMFWNLKPLSYPPKCNIKDSYFGFTPNCSKVNKQLLDVIKQKPVGWDSNKIINLIVTKIIPDYSILNKQKPPILSPDWLQLYVDKLNQEHYHNQYENLEITGGIIKITAENNVPVPIPEPTFMPADNTDNTTVNPDAPANTDNTTVNPDTNVEANPIANPIANHDTSVVGVDTVNNEPNNLTPSTKLLEIEKNYNDLTPNDNATFLRENGLIHVAAAPAGGSRRQSKRRRRRQSKKSKRRKQSKRRK